MTANHHRPLDDSDGCPYCDSDPAMSQYPRHPASRCPFYFGNWAEQAADLTEAQDDR